MKKYHFAFSNMVLCLALCMLCSGCGRDARTEENRKVTVREQTTNQPAEETIEPAADYRGLLRITEFSLKNSAGIRDEDGEFRDWIELENCSDTDVPLTGWTVTDKPRLRRQFISDAVLAPGERLVVFCRDFGLKEEETLYLLDPAGEAQETALCPVSTEERYTMTLQPDGSHAETKWMSPGFRNGKDGYLQWCRSDSRESPLLINEVMVSNEKHPVRDNECYDWVELKNVSEEVLDLSGYRLKTDRDDPRGWLFPQTVLNPGEMICITCDEDTPASDLNTGFALNAVEETLFLYNKAGELADYVLLHDIPIEGSMGRLGGENGFFFFTEPTPGEENTAGARLVSDSPVTLTPEGPHDDVERLQVELSAPGKVFYTLDGTVPTISSTPYTGPIELTGTTVIRAVALEENAVPGRVSTFSYFLNEYHTLPILSLAVDDYYGFDRIYSFGQKWVPVPANLALYENGVRFNRACEVSMKGWTSLSMPKKSLGVEFTGRYGGMLDCDVFGNGITEYDGLVMRVGQDFNFSVFRNELIQDLCREASDCLYTQESKYCILYVNGAYYGIYCLKDDITRQFYANHAGVSVDSVEGFRAPAPTNVDYYDLMVDYGWHSDLSEEKNYRHLEAGINLDSLIDWFLFEAYCGNSDTAGNQRVYRSMENGNRWEYVLYDLDWAFHYWQGGFGTILDGIGNVGPDMLNMLNNLLDSEIFRDRLLKRYAELVGTVLADDYVLDRIDEYVALLRPEIARDHERWGVTVEHWSSNVELLRSTIRDNDYAHYTVRDLCKRLDLSKEERMRYFGPYALEGA